MSHLIIRDLSRTEELDHKSMSDVRGGAVPVPASFPPSPPQGGSGSPDPDDDPNRQNNVGVDGRFREAGLAPAGGPGLFDQKPLWRIATAT